MNLFQSKRQHPWSRYKSLLSLVLFLLVILVFYACVSGTSRETLAKEQETLENALLHGAVYTYALEGQYPESLEQLIQDYHITYDPRKFAVEYEPQGSNLLPRIAVIPLAGEGKEAFPS